MVECKDQIVENQCVVCITCHMFFIYCIACILYVVTSLYGTVLLCLNDINLLWLNLLISIIITNITNVSILIIDDKKTSIKTLFFSSSLNCILSSGTIINIFHHNYDDNLLYNCMIIILTLQYIFMVCDLFLINLHYICDKVSC